MSRFLPLLLLPLVALAADAPDDLTKQARALEKEIEKVRGLKFKKSVPIKVIKRDKDAPKGVNAYYDTRAKEVVLYDDIKGNYAKGVLIHELVHALQDQHFNLRKLHQPTFGSDRELAMAALIEGDAMLVSIEMLQKEQPHIAFMLKTRLETAKNLQNAFLYGIGTKWVKSIKDKGGWKAVDRRYQFPPMSTATILHPGEFIMPVRLGPGRTVGEYGLIKMFHDNKATAARAVEAASGWRGDRLIREGDGTGWAVAFATPEQAKTFQAALTDLRKGTEPKGKHSIQLRGKQVFEVNAPSDREHQLLLERLEGRPLITVYSALDKKVITFGEMMDRLGKADIVCIGEQHDSAMDHHIQLMIIKALYAQDESLGVGMEMFQRPFQKALDRYVAGAISEETFLEDSDYIKRWGFDWSLYRPIVDFCRRNRIALAGLNISSELRGRISKEGLAKLSPEERQLVGEVDLLVKAHREHFFDSLGEMHGHGGKMSKEDKERMYQVMATWDEYMADSAVRFQRERKLRRMVVLAGSGHIDRYFGIPNRALRRMPGGVVRTVRIVLGGEVEQVKAEPHADFVILAR